MSDKRLSERALRELGISDVAPRTDPPTPDALTHILERVARAEQLPQTYTVLPTDRSQPGVRLNDDGSVYREHYHRAIFGQDDVDFATAALAALPSAPDQRVREALKRIVDLPTVVPDHAHGGVHPPYLEWRAVADIARAALSEATTSPEATLDVELLARAMHEKTLHNGRGGVDDELAKIGCVQLGWEQSGCLRKAKAIAAEYARLRGPA